MRLSLCRIALFSFLFPPLTTSKVPKIGDETKEIEIQDLEFTLQTNPEVYILSYNQNTLEKEYKLITNFGMTNPEAELLEIEDETTGFKLQCTPEHKILTKNRGWVEAQHLTEEDELVY